MDVKHEESNGIISPLLIIILTFATIIGFIVSLYAGIRPVVEIRLGEDSPDASDFIIGEGDAWFAGSYPAKFDKPGVYVFNLRTTWLIRPVVVRVKDPNAKTSDIASFFCTTAYADEIIKNDDQEDKEWVPKSKLEKKPLVQRKAEQAEPQGNPQDDQIVRSATQPQVNCEIKPQKEMESTELVVPEYIDKGYNPFELEREYYDKLTDKEKAVLIKSYNILKRHGYDENSFRFKVIKTGVTMLHWGYSRDYRWKYTEKDGDVWGMRDCSSFVYTCFCPYTTFFSKIKETSTTDIFKTAKSHDACLLYSEFRRNLKSTIQCDSDDDSLVSELDNYEIGLIPGDIILTTWNWERIEGIGHAMIYLGGGYVIHAAGTEEDGIIIEKYSRWNVFGSKTQQTKGPRYIISIPDSYDNGTLFSEKYRDFWKYVK